MIWLVAFQHLEMLHGESNGKINNTKKRRGCPKSPSATHSCESLPVGKHGGNLND